MGSVNLVDDPRIVQLHLIENTLFLKKVFLVELRQTINVSIKHKILQSFTAELGFQFGFLGPD